MCLLQDSKTTFVTVNHFRINPRKSEEKNSKTTFVTVNLLLGIGYLLTYMHSKTTFVTVNHFPVGLLVSKFSYSKTTFVTVNLQDQNDAVAKAAVFKNNFCYC